MSSGGAWRAWLAFAREQRGDRNRRRLAWDTKWRRWFDIYIGQGGTPNAAVTFAYRKTKDQLGARPGPYPDGSDAQEAE